MGNKSVGSKAGTRAGRRIGRQTHAMARKAKGKGLEGLFNRHKLTEQTATEIFNGATSIAGIRPDKVRGIRKALEGFGWEPPKQQC